MLDWQKLITDLREANLAASEAADAVIDTGKANKDGVFLWVRDQPEAKVIEAIREAGVYYRRKSEWIGIGYMMVPNSGGQANKRRVAVTVMVERLIDRGWDVMAYRKSD